MFTQLSREDSFELFVFRKLKELKSLILCEGITEKLVVKKLVAKLGIGVDPSIGIVECGGIPHIYNYVSIIALLTHIARKVRKLGVVIDGEDMKPDQRVESIVDALRARDVEVKDVVRVGDQVYVLRCSRPALDMYIAVNGVYSYEFDKHSVHDHGLLLAMRMGRISKDLLERVRIAEEVIDRDTLIELMDQAEEQYLRECFEHIVRLLILLKDDV